MRTLILQSVTAASGPGPSPIADLWPPPGGPLLSILGAVLIGALLLELFGLLLLQAAKRTPFAGDEQVVRRLRPPARLLLPLLIAAIMRPTLGLAESADPVLQRALAIALIAATTWLIIRGVNTAVLVMLTRQRIDVPDNLEARRVHTQLRVVARIVSLVAGVIGIGAILMTFPSIRQLGASLLASAGVAGLVIGLAAQRTIGNFIAGLQIALTGLIHLDDVVVIDGEWGRIEEITSTYVVMRIWDDRRLIVPFSRIIENSFQNWTRRTADLLGTVFIHADYTAPIEALRQEVRRIAERSDHWDGRVAMLVVTDAGPRTIELRALVSAGDAPRAWDLRCEVREGLVTFLQREHPGALPRFRASLDPDPPAESP